MPSIFSRVSHACVMFFPGRVFFVSDDMVLDPSDLVRSFLFFRFQAMRAASPTDPGISGNPSPLDSKCSRQRHSSFQKAIILQGSPVKKPGHFVEIPMTIWLYHIYIIFYPNISPSQAAINPWNCKSWSMEDRWRELFLFLHHEPFDKNLGSRCSFFFPAVGFVWK